MCSSGSAAMPAGARGAYKLARRAVKFGAEILLDDLLVRLSADCPWRDEARGTCGVRFTDLPPRRSGDYDHLLATVMRWVEVE
jgi:hypothetical protein